MILKRILLAIALVPLALWGTVVMIISGIGWIFTGNMILFEKYIDWYTALYEPKNE